MANEWYVQHGDKQYGPLTSANLKKLAAERKITPSTSVRLGAAGTWVPASRVQGLFAAQGAGAPVPPGAKAQPPAAPRPVVAQAVPQASPLDMPPIAAPPPAPLKASPLARLPFGSVAPASKSVEPESSIAAKITGAVGLIFGILALSVFWLPMLGGPMGWIGIVVGALGLILGASGMVLSAMHKGSGLYLNVAGTSSAAVGLVLTIVLGVMSGMFTSKPAPPPVVVVQRPTLAEPPAVETEPPAEPEPEPAPPPEPVWADASMAIEQGPIKASIVEVGIQSIRLENLDFSTLKKSKPQPKLKIRVAIENTTADKIVKVPGWPGAAAGLTGGIDVGGLLKGSELGKTLETATAGATLTDNVSNDYPQVPDVLLFGATTALQGDSSLRPGNSSTKELVFEPPLATIEYLRLELAPAGFGGAEPLRFQIPKAMVTGL